MRWLTSIRWIPSFVLGKILLVDATLIAIAIIVLLAVGLWPVALYCCFSLAACLIATKWLGSDWLTRVEEPEPEDEEDTDRFRMN